MKIKFYTLVLALSFSSLILNAQCPHNSTITSPRLGVKYENSILFCNYDDTETLTTQTYDSYQWYKQQWSLSSPNPNPWIAVSGATTQSLQVNANDDFLFYFKVATSLDGCTEDSPKILVDGFAYSLPLMSYIFQPNTFQPIGDSEFNICDGASVELLDFYPVLYGVHTWYKCLPAAIPPISNDPCIISGITGDSYTATTSGDYGYYACTEYCPNECQFLGDFGFLKLNFGQWSFCNLGTNNPSKENELSLYPNPTVQYLYIGKESDGIYNDISIIDISGKMVLQISNHKYNEPIDVSNLLTGTFIVISKTSDNKVYKNKFIKK